MKLEVHQIRALKGVRQLTELNVTGEDQARAAEEAGIDIVVSGRIDQRAAIRAAAPDTHFCFGLIYGQHVNTDEALRAAFDALNAGADSIYCCLSPKIIEGLAREGVPVVGHVGLVPQKARLTGFRAFGKTLEEAQELWRDVRDLELAGAVAVEIEVVAEPVASAIARHTGMTVISMGSGGGCDVQYLFAVDVLGETVGKMPRHARRYADFAAGYARLQDRRVAAFAAYRTAALDGTFPAAPELVAGNPAETAAFRDWLEGLPE
ncbi:MAG: 3-methyl-2-oxobutanoate hydroxymethyltransferase [Tabrizicola sp.]|jgi:3-methyl-2-oxobutanoate hydroxymethyltransferase|nr:3-methyl-2-oxobutanoate hydroxymethyltransferase [Tabrizicola sp.]